jgi:hypothetical protein
VVSVLAIVPKVRGLKSRATDFKGDKNPQYAFLRRGSSLQPSAPCKVLWHVKNSSKYERDT